MKKILLMISLLWLFPICADADIIYLKDGTKVRAAKVWEEGDRIRFSLEDYEDIIITYSKEIVERIEKGEGKAKSVSRPTRQKDTVSTSHKDVAAGETGGVLDLILARIADFMEKAQKLKSRVRSAMVYPMAVLTFAFLILLALMKWVVPRFKDVLTEMIEDELHVITRTVLAISEWIAFHYGWAILLGLPFVAVILL